jgi:delta(3,5)-delta(2,4)-dienoyl-CoA isomerase
MASASYQYFRISTPAPSVAHVEINRPDKLNAFFEPMWLELRGVFRQLSADPNVRSVVLSGAGERALYVASHESPRSLRRVSRG